MLHLFATKCDVSSDWFNQASIYSVQPAMFANVQIRLATTLRDR